MARSASGLKWWRWREYLRTASETPLVFQLQLDGKQLYQEIADEAIELREEGLSQVKIAKPLRATDKIVQKALSAK